MVCGILFANPVGSTLTTPHGTQPRWLQVCHPSELIVSERDKHMKLGDRLRLRAPHGVTPVQPVS